jgi:glutaredoxin
VPEYPGDSVTEPCGSGTVQLDQRDDGSEIQGELGKKTGGTSVPRVFINQKVCTRWTTPMLLL